MADQSTTADEENKKETKKQSPLFYLRTNQVHGIQDRPTYLTVCKNKYGADYPREQQSYKANNK